MADASKRGEGGAARNIRSISKAYDIVNHASDAFTFTDLTHTNFDAVQSRYFRLFTPIKFERMRLPTSLPEFAALKHSATLSDSPVTTAHYLGGHWSDYNLAAIVHVAACNFRCSYCYVDYKHLAGRDSFVANAAEIVEEFFRVRDALASTGTRLSIFRLSGGEPLLAPKLVLGIYEEFGHRSSTCLLKIESNLSALPFAVSRLSQTELSDLQSIAPKIVLHATIHSAPGQRHWAEIREGLLTAMEMNFDIYPAIGGADWANTDLEMLLAELSGIHRNLPKRLAVRPFNLTYPILQDRRNLPDVSPNDLDAPSRRWERILQAHLGTSYLELPRHLVKLTAADEE
jgi:hypothetical protein